MKKVFLLSGRISSGKNQFADFLKEIYEGLGKKVKTDLFASDLKTWSSQDFSGLATVLNKTADVLQKSINIIEANRQSYGLEKHGVVENIKREIETLRIKKENWFEDKTDITRALLQIYGTQIFRNRVNDDYWIKRTKERIIGYDADVILITDVRFPNEVDFISNSDVYETYSVRITRPIERSGQAHEHISETALDNYGEFSYFINNDSGLDELKEIANILVDDIEKIEKMEYEFIK